eukprot:133298_1
MAEEKSENEFTPILTKQDKDQMKKQFNLIALRIPSKNISKLGQSLKPYTFQRKTTKSFQTDPQNIIDPITNKPQFKCLLLNESIKTKTLESIPKHLIELINECNAKPIDYTLTLNYNKLTALEILQLIIPNNYEIPTHYESIGHIVHFNLKNELLKYKYLIGQIYLDKLPNSVQTIINKTDSISNEFRVFPMEIIAGINKLNTIVKENGCKFSFDFSKVYWNSRLGTEHQRICDIFKTNEIICDMMAGVGPFVIPSAKYKKCIIYANDLNPNSFKYLKENCKINNVEKNINCYNLDGRQFWKMLSKNKNNISKQNNEIFKDIMKNNEDKKEENKSENVMENKFIDHIVMNLPAIAMEFLDVFGGCYSLNEIERYGLPMIHCYCFAPDVNYIESIHDRLNKYLGVIPKNNNLQVRLVRNVAPHKDMYCVSFRLPKEIALCENKDNVNDENRNKHKLNGNENDGSKDPPLKRRKLNDNV